MKTQERRNRYDKRRYKKERAFAHSNELMTLAGVSMFRTKIQKISDMTRAEQKAEEYDKSLDYHDYISDNLGAIAYREGYEQAEKDTIAIIESRLSELLGDAQPTPILRYELQDLIKKIKEEEQ